MSIPTSPATAAPLSAPPVRITVATAAPYDVVIGRGLGEALDSALTPYRTAALLHPAALVETAKTLRDRLQDNGTVVHLVQVPDAEEAKSLGVLAFCWDVFGQVGLTRRDVVIGLGGGTVTDVAGFAAATWMRGVDVVQVPTTLLAMVDAAVGGKTGINTGAGKNMVGAFHEPAAVIADLALLDTLSHAELVSGLAEVVKSGFISDPVILDLIEQDPQAATDPRSPVLAELVARTVAVKAAVVAADLEESDLREILNYGHTLAHAIEKREQFRRRHGEAVAIGMVFVAELAHRLGRLDAATLQRHRAVLEAVGLPTGYEAGAFPELLEYMGADKKARNGTLRFVVLDGIGQPGRLDGPGEDDLALAYAAISTGSTGSTGSTDSTDTDSSEESTP